MSATRKPTHEMPGGEIEDDGNADDGVVNDSLGTIDPADSDGLDEKKESGDTRKGNTAKRED